MPDPDLGAMAFNQASFASFSHHSLSPFLQGWHASGCLCRWPESQDIQPEAADYLSYINMSLMMNRSLLTLFVFVALGGTCIAAPDGTNSLERVVFKGGIVSGVQSGLPVALTNEVTMPHGIKVMTNGTFRVQDGKERHLKEGQALGADGMLASPDGTLLPVFDHIAFRKGQALLAHDGEEAPLDKDKDLGDGRRVTADGFVYEPSGLKRRLLDGEVFDLSGKAVAVSDTVTLKDGKVLVQKDGSLLEVGAGRSLMMNDGTKVLGDGTIVFRDGRQTTVQPGEVLRLEPVGGK